ncbi:TauD/TfdA family dioxygenase [Streptomyces sp. NPDC006552]|uniref:TauD/TfdA family dioxygenase n=1 Tax=Streptomyces sp. NPDC006552 TaxID=3157179 RepID=UPI0033B21DAD
MERSVSAPSGVLSTTHPRPTRGSFRTSLSDPHVALRERLLSNATPLPAPTVRRLPGHRSDDADGLHQEISEQLWDRGLAAVQLAEPLPHDRYTELGRFLGTAIPESDPAVQPFVQGGVVLNLRSEHAPTAEVALQPFARNSLSLHSESSGAAVGDQPRYIVLMCAEPGDRSDLAQTVVTPMRAVARRLSPGTLQVLSHTRYRDSPKAPAVARHLDGRWVFSYRDFLDQELRWTHSDPDTDPGTVNAALRDLLTAMYAPDEAVGVSWRRGLLVVIDNTYYFHGRTAGAAAPPRRQRHLQRLRIR